MFASFCFVHPQKVSPILIFILLGEFLILVGNGIKTLPCTYISEWLVAYHCTTVYHVNLLNNRWVPQIHHQVFCRRMGQQQ